MDWIRLLLPWHWWLVLLGVGSLRAQSITAAGQVRDAATDEPLIGAYVLPARDAGAGTLTDSLGRFRLVLPQPDTLRISYLGYATGRRYVARTDTQLVVALRVRAEEAHAVTVTAERVTAAEFASTTIRRLEIYRNPAAKADPLLAVNTLAAATTPDETANVSLRGSDPRASAVYLNNVPVNRAVRLDQSNGVGQFSIFNTGTIQDLRVFPANPPVEFSQSAAGVVALYTDTELPSARTELSVNLAGGGLLLSRRLGKRTGLSLFGNAQHSAAFTGLNGETLQDIERFRNVDAGFRLLHRFSDRVSLQVFQFLLDENYRYRVRSGAFVGPFDQTKRKALTVANLRWRLGKVRWELNQGFDWDQSSYSLGNIRTEPERRDYFAGLIRRKDQGRWRRSIGLQFNHYRLRTSGRAPRYDYAFRSEDPSFPYADRQAHGLLELFRYTQYRAGSRWLFGAGGRFLVRLGSPGVRSAGQLSVSYRNPAGHRLIFGVGRYQRYVAGAEPGADWGWLRSSQASLEWQFRHDGWTAQLAIYDKQDEYPTENWRIRGVESRLAYRHGRVDAWLTAATVRSRIERGGLSFPSRYDLPYLVRGSVQLQLPGEFTVGLLAQLRRGTYFRPVLGAEPATEIPDLYRPLRAARDAGSRLPAYRRVDLSLSRLFTIGNTGLIAYANVNNIFDRRNVSEWSYNEDYSQRSPVTYSRRVFFLGVQFVFGRGVGGGG